MTVHPAPRNTKRIVFLTVSAVVTAAVFLVSHAVMLPFVLALIVAYILTPLVLRLERVGVPRWAAILVVYVLVLGTTAGFVALSVPRLLAEGKALTVEGPRLTNRIRQEWLPELDARIGRWTGRDLGKSPGRATGDGDLAPPSLDQPPDSIAAAPAVELPLIEPAEERPAVHIAPRADGSYDLQLADNLEFSESHDGIWQIRQAPPERGFSSATMLQEGFDKGSAYLKDNSLTVLKIGQEIATAITRGIFNLFMTLMLAAYLILTHERIIGFFRELWSPGSRESYDRFLRRLDRGLSGVVRGQLLICLVNGLLSAIGFWLFDLKYWPILSVVASVMSLIPIFGSILSSVPAVAIGLTQSPGTALGVLAWIVGIHQLEANFLNPKIIGDSAKIHPVLVVLSLLIGEHFFQITGALFAVPCLSIAQTLFLHFRESTLGLADPTASIPPTTRTSALRTPAIAPLPSLRGFERLGVEGLATPTPAPAATPIPADDAGEPVNDPSAAAR